MPKPTKAELDEQRYLSEIAVRLMNSDPEPLPPAPKLERRKKS